MKILPIFVFSSMSFPFTVLFYRPECLVSFGSLCKAFSYSTLISLNIVYIRRISEQSIFISHCYWFDKCSWSVKYFINIWQIIVRASLMVDNFHIKLLKKNSISLRLHNVVKPFKIFIIFFLTVPHFYFICHHN